jgi:hypothetical protein
MESLLMAAGVTSFVFGAGMTLVAWKIVRENQRREAARVQLLSSLAFPNGLPAVAAATTGADRFADERFADDDASGTDAFLSEREAAPETLFSEPAESGTSSRRLIALASVGVVAVLALATSLWFSGETATAPGQPAAAVATAPAVRRDAPVELLALQHSTTPATGFVVNGRLRNPIDGPSLPDLVAVVDVFDRTGRLVSTARAPIGRPVLDAGESSAFAVAVPHARGVARYRIEFRVQGREAIAHVDLRDSTVSPQSE